MSLSALAEFTPPTKEINWFSGNQEEAYENSRLRRSNAQGPVPLTPATLLLLGLGGAVVGTKVLRNTKK